MSFRNARHQMNNQVARAERNRMKLQKLRDRVRQSTQAFIARQHARLAWWQSAFGAPIAGINWLFARASSLWAAFLALLGFDGKTFSASSSRRPVSVRRSLLRTAMCEGLESRQLMAADLLYVDSFADLGSPAVNSPAVWVGADNAVGGGDDKNVTFEPTAGLVAPGLDGAAYDTLQEAIDAATAGDIIYVAPGNYSGVSITKDLTLLAVGGAANTFITGPSGPGYTGAITVAAGVQLTLGGVNQGFTVTASGATAGAIYLVGDNDDSVIQGNVINGGAVHGILTGGLQDNLTVTNNEINGDGPAALVYVNGLASLPAPPQPSNNVDITNNTFNGGAGAGLLLGLEGTNGDVTGNTFTGTASYGQLEVWGAGNTITGNDFDAAGTPFIDFPGNYDPATIVANNTFASSPIYIEGGGFYSTIQAAVTAAAANDVIVVAAGVYTENITIPASKTNLTIKGPFSGVAGTAMTRDLENGVGEATIEGFIRVSAPGVILDGLRVLNGDNLLGQNVGVYVESTDLTVENSVLYRALAPLDFRAILTVLPAGSSDGLSVTNNAIEGWATGLYVQGANNVSVTGNLFEGNSVGMSADSYTGGNVNLDVTGNSFVNNLIEGFGIGEAGAAWNATSDFTGNTFVGPGIFSYSPNLPPSVLGWGTSATVPGTNGNDAFSVVPSLTSGFVNVLLGMTPVAQIPNTVKIVLNGGDGSDTFTVDIQAIPSAGLEINGQNPTSGTGDSLVLTNSGTNPTSVTHNFFSNSDGSVVIDVTRTISYTGLEPVLDNLSAVNRVFNFTGAAESITLGSAGLNLIIDSTLGESVTFAQPSGSLTITGSAGDTLSISTAFASNVTLNVPTVTLSANIGGTVTGNATTVNVNAGAQIQDGIDAAASGATVNVGAGTFAGGVTITKALTLDGAGTTTIIDGSVGVAAGDTNAAILIPTTTTGAVTISDLVVEDSAAHGIRALNNAGLNLAISGAIVRDNILSGIRVSGGSLNTLSITSSTVSGNRQTGVRIANSIATIDESTISGNTHTSGTAYGIERAAQATLTVTDSVISNNRTGGVLVGGAGAQAVTLTNNSFAGPTPVTQLGQVVNNRANSVDASRNFWGTVDPTAVLIAGTNAALVDFSPMLGSDPASNATSYLEVYVHTLGAQSGVTGRIPEGSALVAANGDLNILPGAYTAATEPVNVPSDVSLQPGASPGVVSAGSLNFAANSNLVVEIDGNSNSPTVTFDQLVTTGSVTIGAGVDLIVDFGYLPAPGDSWVLVDNDLADGVTGTFVQGTSFTGVGPAGQLIPLTVNYGGGTGNDIVLSVSSFANVYAGSGLAALVSPAPGLESGVDSAFDLTADNDLSGTLTVGDTVSFTAPGQAAVTGLIYGYQAFATVQAAFAGAAATATIHSAGWDLLEDQFSLPNGLAIPVTTGSYTVNTFGTFVGFDGTLIINPANTIFTYTPAANENGPEVFSYTLMGGPKTITGTVWIDVTPVNDAPSATLNVGPFVSVEDAAVLPIPGVASAISVGPANESSQTRSFALNFVSGPGSLTFATAPAISSSGVLTYTPAANAFGTHLYEVVLNDNGGTDWAGDDSTVVGTITITVNGVNDAPVAVGNAYSTNEDTVLNVPAAGVLANDTDVESDPLTAIVVTNPANGSLTLNTDGSFTYTPNTNYFGPDSFTYKANDGLADSNIVTVALTVAPVNDAPVANGQSVTVNEDGSVTITLTGSDVDLNTLTFSVTGGPTNGTLSGSGSIRTYTPNANYNGPDSFTFVVNDGTVNSAPATVTITVNPVDDPIDAINDSYTTNEDTPLVVNTFATGVLGNDINIDNDPLNAVLISPPSSGSVALSNNGTFTYTPATNFNGVVSFTYLVSDGVTTDTAVVTITVNAVNDNPVNSVPGAQSTPEDVPLVFSSGNGNLISVSDVDVLAGQLSVQLTVTNGTVSVVLSGGAVVTGGTNGGTTVTIQGTPAALNATLNGLTYTPSSLYFGPATLTVVTNDLGNTGSGGALSDTDVIAITVAAVNNAPVATGDSYAVLEDQVLTVTSPGVLVNDVDVDPNPLTAVLVTGPTNGTLLLNANGSFTYTPNAHFFGTDSFTYAANDGTVNSMPVVVNLTVRPVNDAPTASDDSVSLDEDEPVFVIPVLTNDLKGPTPSEDGQVISIVGLAGIPAELAGSFTVLGGTTLQFVPPANYSGTAIISYTIRDNGQSSANAGVLPTNDFKESTGFVTVTVTPVSDAPTLTFSNVTGSEDTAISLPISAALTDPSETLSGITVSGIPTGSVLTNTALDTLTISGGSITLTQAQLAGLKITPPLDYSGTFALGVSVSSTDSPDAPAITTGTFNVVVTAVNDAPVNTVPGPVTTSEDTPVAIPGIVIADVDAAASTVQVALSVTNGTIAVTLSGATVTAGSSGSASVTLQGTFADINATIASLVFTPNTNYNGAATLTVVSSDLGNTGSGGTQTDTDTVAINVTPVNDAPVANGQSVTVAEDGSVIITLTGSDIDLNALTFSVTGGPTSGTLTGSGNTRTYTPNANFNGSDSFTFVVNDGTVNSAAATVNITVTPVNDAPVALDASVGTIENTSTTFDLKDIVSDFETADASLIFALDPMSFVPSPGVEGTLMVNPNGVWTFVPFAGYTGSFTVKYQVTDLGDGMSPPITVTADLTIVVSPFNDPPVNSVPGAQSTNEDTPLVFSTSTLPTPNAISVSDVDVMAGELSVTLSVNNGTLGLTLSGGAIVTAGALGTGTVTIQGLPVDLNVSLNGLTYTPNSNFNGADTLTIVTNDLGNTGAPNAQTDTDTVAINVTAVNDVPVAVVDSYSVLANGSLNVVSPGVLSNDSDVEGSTLSVSQINGSAPNVGTLVTLGSGANVTLNANGSFVYNPNGAFNSLGALQTATDSFTYTVNDGTANGNTVVVTINLTGVNDKPTGGTDTATTAEETPVVINVLTNDNDIDNDSVGAGNGGVIDPTTVAIVSGQGPSNGTVSVNPTTGAITYTPSLNYNGPDAFQYTVKDDAGLVSDPITVNVTVTAVNDAPVAVGNSYSTAEDTTLTIPVGTGVLVNDSDVDGPTMNAVLVTAATSGTVFLAANGSFVYVPAANFNGVATFTYRVSDGSLLSNIVTVSINVTAVNDAPVANSQSVTVAEDGSVVITLSGSDIDGNSLTFSVTGGPTNGTLTGSGNTRTYMPNADYNGSDSFTFVVNDGTVNSAAATVSITVTAAPDAPVAMDDEYTTGEGDILTVSAAAGVLDNDDDVDGDSLTVTLLAAPVKGSVSLSANGSFTYNPDGDFETLAVGEEEEVTFTYTVTDGAMTDTATVTITVTGQNDQPTAASQFLSTNEDVALTGTVVGADVDTTDVLTYLVSLAPANGTLVLNPNGSFTYTPNANFNGADAFSFIARDDSGAMNKDSVPAIVVVTIASLNDAPVNTVPGSLSTAEDTPLPINSISVFDVEAPAVTVILGVTSGVLGATGPATIVGSGSGSVTLSGTQANVNATLANLVFTPNMGFSGNVTLTVTTSDLGSSGAGGTLTDMDTVVIAVNAVNNPPVASNVTLPNTNEDTPIVITAGQLLTGVLDPDGPSLSITSLTVSSGMGAITGTGPWTFTPNANWSGPVVLNYTVSDTLASASAQALFSVLAINDAPVLVLTQPVGTLVEGQMSADLSSLISFSDVDVGAGNVQLTLTTTAGMAKFVQMAGPLPGGVTVTPAGPAFANTLVITGPLSGVLSTLSLFKIEVLDVDPIALAAVTLPMSVVISDLGNTPAPVQTASGTLNFTVADAAPTIPVSGLASVTEGTNYMLQLGPFSDAAGVANDQLVDVVIYWGDGTTTSLSAPAFAAQLAALNAGSPTTISHLYGDEAAMTDTVIRVSLFSAGKNDETNVLLPKEYQNAGSTPIAVTGVAPTAANVAHTGPYNEGSAAGLITVTGVTDPSAVDFALLQYSVDFGDNGSSLGDIVDQLVPGVNFNVNIPASVLADNPNTPIRVTLKDKDGLTSSYLLNVPVNNVAPTLVSATAAATNVNSPLTISGTFSDPGVIDNPWTVQVNFGSGWVAAGTVNSQGAFSVSAAHGQTTAGTYSVNVRVLDKDGGASVAVPVSYVVSAVVSGRGMFYNGSTFGSNLDTSKQALLPGQASSFSNYTGYRHGITGLAVKIDGAVGTIDSSDFEFHTWNGVGAPNWQLLAAPATVNPVAGPNGYQITFGNGTVVNTWLRVTVKATTGLASPDVFYFGSAIGDVNVGNIPLPGPNVTVIVNAADTSAVRNNQSPTPGSASITNRFDLNKDGAVNAADTSIVRNNQQPSGSITHFVAP